MESKNFQLITIGLVLIVVIGMSVLTYLDYRSIKNLNKNTKFPPWPSKCPDYWQVSGDNKCINVYKIGNCMNGDGANSVMDFDTDPYTGGKGMYYKCNWSQQCNAPWEGVDSIC